LAESQPATSELRAAILEVIGKPIYPYLMTQTRAGFPYSRPLICINDEFTIRMVTRAASLKVQHLARNPHVALLWVDGQRTVLLQGRVTVHHGDQVVDDFYRRYVLKNPARTRQLAPNIERVILELSPTFCRADWFAGFTPVVLRF
jgi:pyridoxine/pyridoxamine 5'-phosphate oxidase